MPYSVSNMPSTAPKGMSDHMKEVWVAAFNNAHAACMKDGGKADECESKAFAIAGAAANKAKEKSLDRATEKDGRPASCFLVVEDPDTPSTWHLPVMDADGTPNHTLMGAAWAALHEGYRGNKYEGPGKEEAIKKLKALYKKEGMPLPSESRGRMAQLFEGLRDLFTSFQDVLTGTGSTGAEPAASSEPEPSGSVPVERAVSIMDVFDQLQEVVYQTHPGAWINDLYADPEKGLFAVLSEGGKLYRLDFAMDGSNLTAGEMREVEVQFSEVPRQRTTLLRQADDKVRWFSVSCSAVLNRVGEIDSRTLFDSFIRHAEATGEYPQRDFYHLGQRSVVGQADYMAREGYVLITSGLFNDSDLARAEITAREAEPDFWGESIEYESTQPPELLSVGDGITIPVYNDGICRFISTLPEERAAALFTRTTQEVSRMNDNQFKALVKLFGGDEAKARAWLESHAGDTNRSIEGKGLVRRNAETTPDAPAPAPAPAEPAPAPADPAPAEPVQRDAEATDATADATTDQPPTLELDEEAEAQIAEHILSNPAFAEMRDQLAQLTQLVNSISTRLTGEAKRTNDTLSDLTERLESVERSDDDKHQLWAADLPARATLRVTHRARTQAPAGDDEAADLASAATETVAKFKSRQVRYTD